MLDHSNRIESVYTKYALDDAKKAWRFAAGLEEMTVDSIIEIQRLLLKRVGPENIGFRRFAVRIGWDIKAFDSIQTFERHLKMICETMNEKVLLSGTGEELSKNCHVAFEDVHPFPDGNGRTGRVLYNWHRLRLGLPIHVIHEGDEQYEYYQWFHKPIPI